MNTNRPRNSCLKNGLQLWARTKSVEPKYSKSSAFPCPTVAQKPQRNAKAMQHKLVHREKNRDYSYEGHFFNSSGCVRYFQ